MVRSRTYYVYIMASKSRVLYAGVTCHLYRRVLQYKEIKDPRSFTARYRVTRLVYYETRGSIDKAIAREKQIKNWRREKKANLIETFNPTWKDLSESIRFDEGRR